jgi:hypothetical protein
MRSNTVAFRGTKMVVEAYTMNDMPAWAVVCGKSVMFAYEGETVDDGAHMLEQILNSMSKGSSTAIYELRCYKLKAKTEITSATEHNRAFPFKLYEEEDMNPFEAGRRHYKNEADARLDKMQQQIDMIFEMQKNALLEDEEEQKPEGVAGIISGIMADPMMKQVLFGALAGIVKKIVPMDLPAPAMVAGIDQQAAEKISVLKEGQPEKVQQAVYILCSKDPLLGDHLEKLAGIAVNNPGQFEWIIGMLKNV